MTNPTSSLVAQLASGRAAAGSGRRPPVAPHQATLPPLPEAPAGTIPGQAGPTEPAVLDPATRRPPHLVEIKVHRDGSGFRTEGWDEGKRIFGDRADDGSVVKAYDGARFQLTLDRLEKRVGADKPRKILAELNAWSTGLVRFARWLNSMRAHHGADLQLLFTDTTGFDINWEAFRLDDSEPDSDGWLGSLVPISRWTQPRRGVAEPPVDVAADCEGGAICYVDPDYRDNAIAGQRLAAFMNEKEPYTVGPLFVAALDSPRTPLPAVVYIGAHGNGERSLENKLGELILGEAMLEYRSLALLGAGRTLVFLNTCNSAVIFEIPDYGNGFQYGFPEYFLSCRAAGVIGTTMSVGSTAPWVLETFVEEATRAPGTPIPELLRRVRAQADQDLEASKTGERYWRWLETFNYVYYGNPNATLRLVEAS